MPFVFKLCWYSETHFVWLSACDQWRTSESNHMEARFHIAGVEESNWTSGWINGRQTRKKPWLHSIPISRLESVKGGINDDKTSSQPLKVHHKDQSSKNILRWASDWKIQFDLELDSLTSPKRAKAFPSEIAVVSGEGSCPDGVVWSMETKTVIMLELTSPWEENFDKWHKRKMRKYN